MLGAASGPYCRHGISRLHGKSTPYRHAPHGRREIFGLDGRRDRIPLRRQRRELVGRRDELLAAQLADLLGDSLRVTRMRVEAGADSGSAERELAKQAAAAELKTKYEQ